MIVRRLLALVAWPFRRRLRECRDNLHRVERLVRALGLPDSEVQKFRLRCETSEGEHLLLERPSILSRDVMCLNLNFPFRPKRSTSITSAQLVDDKGYIFGFAHLLVTFQAVIDEVDIRYNLEMDYGPPGTS